MGQVRYVPDLFATKQSLARLFRGRHIPCRAKRFGAALTTTRLVWPSPATAAISRIRHVRRQDRRTQRLVQDQHGRRGENRFEESLPETIKNIKGAWVNEIKVVTDDNGNVSEWRVNLRVTFVVS